MIQRHKDLLGLQAEPAGDLFSERENSAADDLFAEPEWNQVEAVDESAGDEPQPDSDLDAVAPGVENVGRSSRLPSWDEILFGKQPED